jgi:hypothetical protein
MKWTDNYELLLRKLDEFTRKYYVNQFIRGAIYASALLLAAFLVINVLEYVVYFSSVIRTILFFGFLAGALFIIVRWIALPLLHYSGWEKSSLMSRQHPLSVRIFQRCRTGCSIFSS